MTPTEAVVALEALSGKDDPEADHARADEILLETVNPFVAAAYRRLTYRATWWAGA